MPDPRKRKKPGPKPRIESLDDTCIIVSELMIVILYIIEGIHVLVIHV